jgi:SAM-dependent methyltransferase
MSQTLATNPPLQLEVRKRAPLAIRILRNLLRIDYKESFIQLLRVDGIRLAVSIIRYFTFVVVLKKLRTFDPKSKDIGVNTVLHNLKGLAHIKSLGVNRSSLLVRPLSVLSELNSLSKILCVGPRSEGELLNLRSFGFKNVHGLDLISYSSWVDLGDMHAMPYKDNSWDAMVLGWILAYSDNRKKAAMECVRCTKAGGVIAIGVQYCPQNAKELSQKLGYDVCDENRLESIDQILELFHGHVDQVYFRQDLPS